MDYNIITPILFILTFYGVYVLLFYYHLNDPLIPKPNTVATSTMIMLMVGIGISLDPKFLQDILSYLGATKPQLNQVAVIKSATFLITMITALILIIDRRNYFFYNKRITKQTKDLSLIFITLPVIISIFIFTLNIQNPITLSSIKKIFGILSVSILMMLVFLLGPSKYSHTWHK